MKTYFARRTGVPEERMFLKLIGEYSGYEDLSENKDGEDSYCVLQFVIVREHLVSILVVEHNPEFVHVERTPLHTTINWRILSDGSPQLQGTMLDYADEVEFLIKRDRVLKEWRTLK